VTAEKYSLTIGVLEPRGRQRVTTIAVNLGEALHIVSKRDIIVAEQRLGLGTLGPEMGEPNPRVLTELLSANLSERARLKVQGIIYPENRILPIFRLGPGERWSIEDHSGFEGGTVLQQELIEKQLEGYQSLIDIAAGLASTIDLDVLLNRIIRAASDIN